MSTKGRRSLYRLALASLAAISLVIGLAIPGIGLSVLALSGSSFESTDGNLVVDTTEDWANAPGRLTDVDLPSGQSDNAFGQGAKEDIPNPTVVNGSIPNNKSDLTRFYVAQEKASGSDYLYLAWERANTLGTANMDFEFNQSTVLGSNNTTPNRTANDILVTYDFDKGGKAPSIGLLRWLTTGAASQCEASNALPCWGSRVDLSAAGFADGSINDGFSVVDPIAPNAPRTLADKTFGEAAINLTASGVFPPNQCVSFGSAYLKSRSSTSFTAELKDFIAPIPVSITNCASISIHKVDDSSPANALQGAVFTLYTDAAPVGGSRGAEDTATAISCTTDASGNCTLTNVPFGEYWVVETTGVPGYQTAADQHASVTAGSGTLSFTFTDPRLFTIIVIVCRQSDNSLYSSSVTIDGVTKTSLAYAGANDPLCGTLGARYENKQTGSYSGDVTITP